MTTPAVSREILAQKEQALTSLQAEWRNFRLLLSRLLDFFMDSFFDLSSQGQERRALIVRFLVLLVLFALLSLSIRQSSFPIQDLFNILLNPLDIVSGESFHGLEGHHAYHDPQRTGSLHEHPPLERVSGEHRGSRNPDHEKPRHRFAGKPAGGRPGSPTSIFRVRVSAAFCLADRFEKPV
jgi:hypothetical protein